MALFYFYKISDKNEKFDNYFYYFTTRANSQMIWDFVGLFACFVSMASINVLVIIYYYYFFFSICNLVYHYIVSNAVE